MTGRGTDGAKVSLNIDQCPARVRLALASLDARGIRSFVANLFKACQVPRETIAEAMRCSVETVDRDAKLPCLDVAELFAAHELDPLD